MKLPIALLFFSAAASSQDLGAPKFTPAGELQMPANYREWVFLSAGLGMTYDAAASASANPPFQNVFVSRPGYDGFLKTGLWPDNTTFILEIRASEAKGSINQNGRFQTGIAAIEAEVKQAGQWTFYAFGKEGKQGKPLARSERCYSCHAENGAVDNTFVQFYPTLLPTAKAKGTLRVTAEGH
jgi:hypothetical protein